jgi:uncharacterized RDD family membrane protein YckC
MEYEDLLTIDTPEGVPIDLTLAGYGSRFIASAVDGALKLLIIVAVAVALGVSGGLDGGGLAVAVFLLVAFLVTVGYDVLFEVLAGGRTPGKRWGGLRVVQADGRPVTFTVSAVRNVLRLLDGPGTAYLVGTIAILATRRNQRVGDLVAGTVVVRERPATPPARPTAARLATGADAAARWDVTGVSPEELAAVRRFLLRRDQIDDAARALLARRIADGLRPKVGGPGAELPAERFLEQLATERARGDGD